MNSIFRYLLDLKKPGTQPYAAARKYVGPVLVRVILSLLSCAPGRKPLLVNERSVTLAFTNQSAVDFARVVVCLFGFAQFARPYSRRLLGPALVYCV